MKEISSEPHSLTPAEQVKEILTFLSEKVDLKSQAFGVKLFVPDIKKFAEVNTEYKEFFGLKPPTRSCLELPGLDNQILLQLFFENNSEPK